MNLKKRVEYLEDWCKSLEYKIMYSNSETSAVRSHVMALDLALDIDEKKDAEMLKILNEAKYLDDKLIKMTEEDIEKSFKYFVESKR